MSDMSVLDAFVIELAMDVSKLKTGQAEVMAGFRKLTEEGKKTGEKIEKQTADALDSIEKLGRAALGIFAAFTAGRDIKSFVQSITDINAGIGRTSRVLNTNVQTLSAWRMAVERVGGSAEGLTQSVNNMIQGFEQWRFTGDSPIIALFKNLRVPITDAKGHLRDFGDIYLETAAKVQQKFPHDAAGAAYFLRNMGADPGTINLLLTPVSQLRRMLEDAKKLAPTPADIAAAQKMQDALAVLEQTSTRLGTTVYTSWVPTITSLLWGLNGLGAWLQKNPDTLNIIADGLLAIGSAITIGFVSSGLGVAFRGLAAIFSLFSASEFLLGLAVWTRAIPVLSEALFGLSAAIELTPIGWILGAIVLLGLEGWALIAHWDQIADAWHNIWERMKKDPIKGVYAGVGELFGFTPDDKDPFWKGTAPQSSRGSNAGNSSSAGGADTGGLLGLVRRLEGSGDSAVSKPQGGGHGGAIGRYQITSDTARRYGFNPAMLKDPLYNTIAASVILADLSKKYHGDLDAVLVAYNAGPGTADKWLRSGRNPMALPAGGRDETLRYLAHAHRLTSVKTVSQLSAGLGQSIAGGSGSVDKSTKITIQQMDVHSRATDAAGIAGDVGKKLQQVTIMSSAQAGPQ